jgi:hypothetical protein
MMFVVNAFRRVTRVVSAPPLQFMASPSLWEGRSLSDGEGAEADVI